MNKEELLNATAKALKRDDVRKHVGERRTPLYIYDANGKMQTVVVNSSTAEVLYTQEDVENIFDALIETMIDGLSRNEEIDLRGYFNMRLVLNPARKIVHPGTHEEYVIPEKYKLKVKLGKRFTDTAEVFHKSVYGEPGYSEVKEYIDEDHGFSEADAIFDEIESENGEE